ncbi:MAG: hypothetical protein ACE5E7_12690 [Anaerolineae bacterium]
MRKTALARERNKLPHLIRRSQPEHQLVRRQGIQPAQDITASAVWIVQHPTNRLEELSAE